MKMPSFLEGVVLAFGLSLAAILLFNSLSFLLGAGLAFRGAVAAVGLAYIAYLLLRSGAKAGRLTVLVSWAALATIAWLWPLPWMVYLGVHVGLAWLIRSLYFHAGAAGALADLGLNAAALLAMAWAFQRTGSVFPSLWCFFLAQALFIVIPRLWPARGETATNEPEDRFQRAYRAADAALRRLSSNP